MNEIKHIADDIENISVCDSFVCSPENSSNYVKSIKSLKLMHINIRSINCNFNSLIVLLHREYERHEFEKAKKDPKATWNVVKKITNLKSKTSSAEELLSVSASAVESVNLVNNYFANIGRDLASKISPISPANLPPAIGLSSLLPVQSMALLPTDFKEVETIIVSLRDRC
ncbi:hypothetical protein ACJJTC_019676, partial [Scirpophaga incertulas]